MDLKHQYSHLYKRKKISNCFMCSRRTRNGSIQKFPNEVSNDYMVQCKHELQTYIF